MKDIESAILSVFRQEPKEYDTSELAMKILPEYALAEEMLESQDRQKIQQAKIIKFRLHRKLLYYLNKLVAENILSVARVQEKGEKVFALTMEEGEITFEKGHKKITITKSISSSNYIESYEKQGLMKKFEEGSWINRINSLMIECSLLSADKAYSIVTQSLNIVNDAVALNDFQKLIGRDSRQMIEKLSQDVIDLDRTLSLIISLENIDRDTFRAFIADFAQINPSRINIVFSIDHKGLQKNAEAFRYVIEEFSRQKIKINIKNRELSQSVFFKGRAGIYSFDEEEFREYQSNIKGKVAGIACSQCSIAMNLNKFFDTHGSGSEFRQAVLNAAKAILSANAVQRRKSGEYFRMINSINSPNPVEFYKLSRNYIRFWNYDWHKDLSENQNMLELLRSTKELILNFCMSEETIFKSCGIPIRFRIAFSSAFRNFDAKFMGERDYKKANVNSIEDYYSGEINDFITAREKLLEVFDGCDRLRIFRSSRFSQEDIIREISLMLSTYKIPFFTYDFSQLRGIVRLTNFI